LVNVEDQPLAKLLRAAEPPNHTDWDMKTANFRKAYDEGNYVISFVKTSVTEIMNIVRTGDDKPDAKIAIDYFSRPEPTGTDGPPKNIKGEKGPGGDPPLPPPPPPPAKKRAYRLAYLEGGFAIRPGSQDIAPPKRLLVTIAYDVMSGSPWRLFDEADFDLTRKDRSGLSIDSRGVTVKPLEPNKLEIKNITGDFEVVLTGFDTSRDLIVRAYDPKEPSHGREEIELHEEDDTQAGSGEGEPVPN
jgi:hypothetical protein